MTDPWADVRERDDDSDYRDLNGYIDDLLVDADALLAVVRATQRTEKRLGTNTREIREALTALPEHLRG